MPKNAHIFVRERGEAVEWRMSTVSGAIAIGAIVSFMTLISLGVLGLGASVATAIGLVVMMVWSVGVMAQARREFLASRAGRAEPLPAWWWLGLAACLSIGPFVALSAGDFRWSHMLGVVSGALCVVVWSLEKIRRSAAAPVATLEH